VKTKPALKALKSDDKIAGPGNPASVNESAVVAKKTIAAKLKSGALARESKGREPSAALVAANFREGESDLSLLQER
jgi:hypothetical protein